VYVIVKNVDVGRVGVCMLCTYVSEERGDGVDTGSEVLSLMSYILVVLMVIPYILVVLIDSCMLFIMNR
jgi:hypothetical protein